MHQYAPGGRSSPIVEAPIEETTSVNFTVVEAVGAASNTPIDALPPLHESVDPDGLSNLLDDPSTEVSVAFEYSGFLVRIRSGEQVEVHEP